MKLIHDPGEAGTYIAYGITEQELSQLGAALLARLDALIHNPHTLPAGADEWTKSVHGMLRALHRVDAATSTSGSTDTRPTDADLRRDLAMLVHRLCRAVHRTDPDNPLTATAIDFLRRHNLEAQALRGELN